MTGSAFGRKVLALLPAAVAISAAGDAPVATPSEDPATFLEQLAGEWSVVSEAKLGPGEDPIRTESREVARWLGERWLVAESTGVTATGDPFTSIRTIGWDPAEKKFLSTWIDTMQSHLWSYTGSLDETSTALILETEGPVLGNPQTTARYREVIEIRDEDRKVMRSMILGPDGEWFEFALAEYRRIE